MSDHTINIVLLICAVLSAPCELVIGYVVIQEYRRDTAAAASNATMQRPHRPFWQWLGLGLLSLGPLIALGLVYLTVSGTIHWQAATIGGSTDIPGGVLDAQIPVSLSPPYVVHVSTDWGGEVEVMSKKKGQFFVRFSEPSPQGGGVLDWQVTPRAGAQTVSAIESEPTTNPTAAPTPKPWQSFAENGYMGQVFIHEIQADPLPGPHTVSIVATDASHQFAKMLLGWLQSSYWAIITHGQPDAFIGEPSEYALDDGITIRARAGNVDAETLRLAFRVMGLNVHRVILPDSDARTYPVVEIGNIPADQR